MRSVCSYSSTTAATFYFRNQCSGSTVANYQISANNRGGICVLPAVNGAAINGSTSTTGSGTTDPFANLATDPESSPSRIHPNINY